MKKSLLICMFSALAVGTLVTSCSDDNNGNEPELIVCPVDGTTFTDVNGLVLTYSGQPMIGKQVVFTPSTTESGKATLVLSGTSIGSLPVSLQSKADATVPVAGVIPGETSTTIEILYKVDGDKITFDGEDTKDGRVIKYSGEALNGSMTLNLEVTMPENELAGTSWNLQAYDQINGKTPVYYAWESKKSLELFPGFALNMEQILTMLFNSKLIGGELTPQDALRGVLNKVSFNADGNIVAEYKEELTDPDWKVSPLNIAMYTVPSQGNLKLYLSLAQIMANVEKTPSSKATQAEVMGNLMAMVVPMLSNGINLKTDTKDGVMTVYLDTEFVKPFLLALSPLFEDETFIASMIEMMKPYLEELGMAEMEPLITGALKQIPGIFESTSKVEFGLNLVK